jgi:hypothetical protein
VVRLISPWDGRPGGALEDGCLFAASAALITCNSSGLIPQDWHLATNVLELAVAGSKFGGMGLENVHMGQIHVAFVRGTGGGE